MYEEPVSTVEALERKVRKVRKTWALWQQQQTQASIQILGRGIQGIEEKRSIGIPRVKGPKGGQSRN